MRFLPRSTAGRIAAACVLLLAATAVVWFQPFFGSDSVRITAYFSRTTGLYTGDDVRVLGVRVGSVEAIHPEGTTVRVELDVDASNKIPVGAKAAIVAPSLVSGRFVQLAPAYISGPAMTDGASIPQSRTAVPVEFDEVKRELIELATALGPKGLASAKNGSLSRIITVADANLSNGAAARLRESITAMSSAAGALSDSRGDLFGTIKNLNSFVHNLAVNDAALRRFSGELATFSRTLADNKGQLATAVDALDQALKLVTDFVKSNTDRLGTSVKGLADLASTLAGKSDDLAQILQNAPFSVDDFYQSIQRHAVVGRLSLDNFQGAAQLLCGALLGTGGSSQDCATAVGPLLKLLGISSVPGTPGSKQAAAGALSTPISAPTSKPNLLQTVTSALSGGSGTNGDTDTDGLLALLGLGGSR